MADDVLLGHRDGVAVVEDGDDDTEADAAIGDRFDDLGVLEDRLELTNTPLHVALFVLCGVIIAVLLQVAEFPGPLDLAGDVDATARREILQFGAQPSKGAARQLVLGHAQNASGARSRVAGASVRTLDVVARTHRVAVIGGDGIGPEVIAEALKAVAATGVVLDTVYFDLGGARYLRDGEVLSDETLNDLRAFDAILLGAVGTPDVPPGVIERGLLLKMRFGLDLFVNHRPFVGVAPGHERGHDFIVIRENTEGSYLGEGGLLRKGTSHEVATQGSVNTRFGVERCVRYAFDLARTRQRKHVTLVHKTNVLTFAGDLWQRTFDIVAADYPDVGTAYNHVDAACIYFVQDPHRYDVVVTDNLFGDILTDLGGAVSGGIGVAASANLNPARTGPSMFEPIHGSAPDIAGKGIANPVAAILSAAMMLEHLGEHGAAATMRRACTDAPSGRTVEVGDAICARLVADSRR